MEGLRAFLGLEEEKHILCQCREAYIYVMPKAKRLC